MKHTLGDRIRLRSLFAVPLFLAWFGMAPNAQADLEVIPVPWVAGNTSLPHSTYNGVPTLFKAMARGGTGVYDYDWDFNGDGVFDASFVGSTDPFNLGATYTYPALSSDRLYYANVRVTSGAETETVQYPVYVHVSPLPMWAMVNKAVDDGLWNLHVTMQRGTLTDGTPYGYWPYPPNDAACTGAAIEAFEIQGHLPTGDYNSNPYVETVQRGLAYLLDSMTVHAITPQPAGDPDSNGNGIGIGCYSEWHHSMYECGITLMTFASSLAPARIAETGPPGVVGRAYADIVQDMVDYLAYGQTDPVHGVYRGGWRYEANYPHSDNSVSQWPAIGMQAAETSFGMTVPTFVRDELSLWVDYIQNDVDGDPLDGGSGYSDPTSWVNVAKTGGLLAEMFFYGDAIGVQRAQDALTYIDLNWQTDGEHFSANSYYAFYSLMKGLRLMEVETLPSGLDWYGDSAWGYAPYLVGIQYDDGSWPPGYWSYGTLSSAWAILILQPHPTVIPPVAVANATPLAVPPGALITFDHSASYHPLAGPPDDRTIVTYRWDFNEDGLWDFVTTDPVVKPTWTYYDVVGCGMPGVHHTAVLEVEDDLGYTDQDDESVVIEVSLLNHPPVADGDPTDSYPNYEVPQHGNVVLDASQSYDPDSIVTGDDKCDPLAPDDYITLYQWDLDNDGIFDVTGMTYLFDIPDEWAVGTTHTVQLRVTDDGTWAGPDGGGPKSAETTVSLFVLPNQPPDCSDAFASVEEIWPPNHKMVSIQVLGCVDPEGGPITITLLGITQDEPVDAPGNGDGKTSPDGMDIPNAACMIRAERQGGGNGRVYTVWFLATDEAGAACEGSVTVDVPHNPGQPCIDDGQLYDSMEDVH